MTSCPLTNAELAEFPLWGGASGGRVVLRPRDAHFWTVTAAVPLVKDIRVTNCATRGQDLLKIMTFWNDMKLCFNKLF